MGMDDCSLFLYSEEEKAVVRKEFGLTEKLLNEGVDSILEWFNKQPHLVEAGISRVITEMMIVISKGSIERAKEKIDNFYKYRALFPEMFQTRELILHNPKKIWDIYSVVPLPKLQDNRRISIVKFGEDLTNLDNLDFYRRTSMILDLKLKYDYMLGDIWIVDFENLGWAKLISLNPMVYKKMSQLFILFVLVVSPKFKGVPKKLHEVSYTIHQKGLNFRLYAIHVLKIAVPASIANRVLDFFKQFVSALILSRVVVHDSLESLYKHVPKECLPEDYGGNAPHTDILTENVENEMRKPEITAYLLECSKMVSDEKLRQKDNDSEEFLSGSFKKLEFD